MSRPYYLAIIATACGLLTTTANAQHNQLVLNKFREVATVVNAIELRKIGCDAAEVKVRLGSRDIPSSHPLMVESNQQLDACATGPSSKERADLATGLQQLESKPAARAALRSYFLAWGQFLRALGPIAAGSINKNAMSKKMDDFLEELILELSL